jgi:hypothetical protein
MAPIVKDYGYTLAELRKLSDDDHMSITLRAEFFFDDEVNTWHYRVPALHITGTQASSTATPRRSLSRSPSLLQPDFCDHGSGTAPALPRSQRAARRVGSK